MVVLCRDAEGAWIILLYGGFFLLSISMETEVKEEGTQGGQGRV